MSGPSSASPSIWSETQLANNGAGPSQLPSAHLLSQPRPEATVGPPEGVVDTTTLAAHDFDVDPRSGFMPPQPPLARLPLEWEVWEVELDAAISQKLCLGSTPGLDEESRLASERWREGVRNVSVWDAWNISGVLNFKKLLRCQLYPPPSSKHQRFCFVALTSSSHGSCTSTSIPSRLPHQFSFPNQFLSPCFKYLHGLRSRPFLPTPTTSSTTGGT